MAKITIIPLLAIVLAISPSCIFAESVAEKLDKISVMIESGRGSGSGVLFKRGDKTFVWTAAHVIRSLRNTRTVPASGDSKSKTEVYFDDAKVVKYLQEKGRIIGRIELFAKVIKYSDANSGRDLAILMVRKRDFIKESALFHTDNDIPGPGTELYHVGSLLGSIGSNSLTTGIVSHTGRVLENNVYDQTTATAFPGSSGGGVFLKDNGLYIGMLVRGAGEGFNLIVPVREIVDWAKKQKVEWAISCEVEMPSDEELEKIPVEDQ